MKTLQEMEKIARESNAAGYLAPPAIKTAEDLFNRIRNGDEGAMIEALKYYTFMDYTKPCDAIRIILNAVAIGRMTFPGRKPADGIPEEKIDLEGKPIEEGGE